MMVLRFPRGKAARKKVSVPGLSIGLPLLAVSLLVSACSGAPRTARPPAVAAGGPRVELDLVPGPAYAQHVGFGPFGYTVQPQVAAWIETAEGRFVETLFVTARANEGAWRMAPEGGRPEALPVWSHLRDGGPDATSAATSAGETRAASPSTGRLPPGRYIVKLEVNRSYDWNATYTKDNSGVNGQPSLVYRAELEIGGADARSGFHPVGRGSVDGSNGEVRPGLDGITTAHDLFSGLSVSFVAE